MGVAYANESKIQSADLRRLVIEDGPESIYANIDIPLTSLPGPLEGGVESIRDMPAELKADVEKELSAEDLSSGSFAGLVNSTLIFRVGQDLATLAAKALRRVKYQLKGEHNEGYLFSLLSGLAILSAVTRSTDLASEVQILTRVIRRRGQLNIPVDNAIRIGLIAAAANIEHREWCKFSGEWITENSFESLDKETAENLRSHIAVLCHVDPMLWETCARAEAACSAFSASQ